MCISPRLHADCHLTQEMRGLGLQRPDLAHDTRSDPTQEMGVLLLLPRGVGNCTHTGIGIGHIVVERFTRNKC